MKKPELLAPAGNLEKLHIAYAFGADACYVGGHVFGLRKYAENFTLSELASAIKLANQKNKQLYVVLNGFAHDSDIDMLIDHLHEMNKLQPHAFIISDLGICEVVKQHTTIPIHVSTQASVTNAYGCQFWKDHGASRIILAREVSIQDCVQIQKQCPIELEIFIHGAMCASYSGKCTISNISAGRDSNRGGCVQSCRHKYELVDPTTNNVLDSKHIMNAKDLMGLYQIPAIIQANIASVKIEGRMKSNMYVANAVRSYRAAIDYCYDKAIKNEAIEPDIMKTFETQLQLVSNRQFSSGGLEQRPRSESIHYNFGGYQKQIDYVGIVRDTTPHQQIYIDVKGTFKSSDTLTVLHQNGETSSFQPTEFWSSNGESLNVAKPNTVVRLPFPKKSNRFDVICKLTN